MHTADTKFPYMHTAINNPQYKYTNYCTSSGILMPSRTIFPSTEKWWSWLSESLNTKCSLATNCLSGPSPLPVTSACIITCSQHSYGNITQCVKESHQVPLQEHWLLGLWVQPAPSLQQKPASSWETWGYGLETIPAGFRKHLWF